jgi:hypothetical protein
VSIQQLEPGWSLHIVGPERGGAIEIFLRNALTAPGPHAAVFATISGTDGNPILIVQNVCAA